MFQKILIANRGEIALRIIRACRELGIRTVAIYSQADAEALHAQLADEAICIGPSAAAESYLDMERILSACIAAKADAIHPGFGFLSENSKFADMCRKCGITFIGPSAEVIERMGNKSEARNTMIKAGIPVVPGTERPLTDHDKSGTWRRRKRHAAFADSGRFSGKFQGSTAGSNPRFRRRFHVYREIYRRAETY